jgi:pyruvate/2-oxoglutarate dehydrogenase complex dihydrolipoamide dehydrogenase (E3) component
MTESNHFDVLIIGAGQAGIPLAHDLAKAGKRVALGEEKDLGGSCVNFGCTPTKAVIVSARVAHLARRGNGFIKVIINAKTNRILGAAVLASEGAELVHLYVDMMNADAPYSIIRDAIHIHPTLAEAIQSAVKPFE